MTSAFNTSIITTIGPVPITSTVVITWGLMLVLVLGARALTRHLSRIPSSTQAALELIVDTVDKQINDTMQVAPARYRNFIGTLFVFIFCAKWSSLVPGIEPPTAHIETDAALARLVFLAVIWYGVSARGWLGYLSSFAVPTPLMIPLNFIETITRTFSLLVRLFGNVMSGVFLIGLILSFAGLFVPIPLMALDLLTGTVQAYIFAVLAMVFIAAPLGEGQGGARASMERTLS